jgi:hypothetical protein
MVIRTCSVEGCDQPHRSKGLCESHYRKWRRWGDPLMSGRQVLSPYERVMDRTERVGDCLLCTFGSKVRYPRVGGGSKEIVLSAHRVVYEHHHGPLAEGQVVRHTCDNTRCVEISHLEAGSQADNIADMASRDRGWWQKNN